MKVVSTVNTTDEGLLDKILLMHFTQEEIVFIKSLYRSGKLHIAGAYDPDQIPPECTHGLYVWSMKMKRDKFN